MAVKQRVKCGYPQPVSGHGNRLLTRPTLGTAVHIKGNGEVAILIRDDFELPNEQHSSSHLGLSYRRPACLRMMSAMRFFISLCLGTKTETLPRLNLS